jgi:type III restriction enzyme
VHRPGEENPTVEELIVALRERALRVGVVVDEAHHSFFSGSETQAMLFFREVLNPDYTLLITATPDDKDITRFKKSMGTERLNRITIGRTEPVDEGLVKQGIKCVAYFAAAGQEHLVDYEDVALREGAATHKRMKEELKRLKVDLTPLMLVQVDSRDKSVERAKSKLLTLGFSEKQIAVHTAAEPDSGLLAIANDESREVLIFKMAVALGFDAPRATTLVSMRSAHDEDFGVQLVGRILRVHRRLQVRARSKSLPPVLHYGYVFLADAQAQTGLDLAGQRINRMQTEYAKISPTTAVVQIGGETYVQVVDASGQMSLLPVIPQPHPTYPSAPEKETQVPVGENLVLQLLMQDQIRIENGAAAVIIPPSRPTAPTDSALFPGRYCYRLRDDVPRRFKTQAISSDSSVTEEDCAQKFILSSREILQALASKVKVERRTLEVFTHQLELDFISARMDVDQAARVALKVLTKNEAFDGRELRRALLRKLKANLQEEAIEQADDDEQVRHMLNVILCARPELLYNAQKAALASHCGFNPTEEPLPETLQHNYPLPASRLNVYRVFPPELNTWERPFAELLDRDTHQYVRWWHRNLPHKPWSIQVVLDTGKGFFPDFIIGINERRSEDGGLLADPKYAFETTQELPKTYARHPVYGRVLILSLQGGAQWRTVRYDERQHKAMLDHEFRLSDAAGY